MARKLILFLAGTSNTYQGDFDTNVSKASLIVAENDDQLTYYDTGIGAMDNDEGWGATGQKLKLLFSMATGYGMDPKVQAAYQWISKNYQEGDEIFLFGFSRGAYTARVLAALIKNIGLVGENRINQISKGLRAYKSVDEAGESASNYEKFKPVREFRKFNRTRPATIKFVGVWDTVSSILVPRRYGIFTFPVQQTLPHTASNPAVEIFRQAISIDETKSMFRLNKWKLGQVFQPNPRSTNGMAQDEKQVWFAGDHADIGGGYAEAESGLSKFSLAWMLNEAREAGLQLQQNAFERIALGINRPGAREVFAAPDAKAQAHEPITGLWKAVEWIPKPAKFREDKSKATWTDKLGFYFPNGERRVIPEGANIHKSVLDRMAQVPGYAPVLPGQYTPVA